MSRAPLVLSAAAIFCASSFLAVADEKAAIASAAARARALRYKSRRLNSGNTTTAGIDTIAATTRCPGDGRFSLILSDILSPFRVTNRRPSRWREASRPHPQAIMVAEADGPLDG